MTHPGTTLTDEQVAELRRLEAEATPGPWGSESGGLNVWGHDNQVVAFQESPEARQDAALIAAMRNALAALLDERDALRAEVERLRPVLAAARAYLDDDEGGLGAAVLLTALRAAVDAADVKP